MALGVGVEGRDRSVVQKKKERATTTEEDIHRIREDVGDQLLQMSSRGRDEGKEKRKKERSVFNNWDGDFFLKSSFCYLFLFFVSLATK